MGGKHNPDDVLIGMQDSPEIKALATLVAEADGIGNFADWMRQQIFSRATANGIMFNGKVTAAYRDRVIVMAAAIRQAKREESERRRARAAAKATANINNIIK